MALLREETDVKLDTRGQEVRLVTKKTVVRLLCIASCHHRRIQGVFGCTLTSFQDDCISLVHQQP